MLSLGKVEGLVIGMKLYELLTHHKQFQSFMKFPKVYDK